MANIIPTPNATGVYTVASPFTVVETAVYECIAIRFFKDLAQQSIDVFERYYAPYGITEAKYQQDVAAGAALITLSSESAGVLYIPSTYITSYPNVAAVTFRHRVLSVSLGAVPDTLALDNLKARVAEACSDVIGIEPTVATHSVNLTDAVTPAQALAWENARQAKITQRTTTYAQLLAAQQTIAELTQRVTILEQLLVSNHTA